MTKIFTLIFCLYLPNLLMAEDALSSPWEQSATFKFAYEGTEYQDQSIKKFHGVMTLSLLKVYGRDQNYIIFQNESHPIPEIGECESYRFRKEDHASLFVTVYDFSLCFPTEKEVELHQYRQDYRGQKNKYSPVIEGYRLMTSPLIRQAWQ